MNAAKERIIHERLNRDIVIKQVIYIIKSIARRLNIPSTTIANWIYADFLGKHNEN